MKLVTDLRPSLWNANSRNYRVHMPHDVTVRAACEDVGCDQWRTGWETVCDESTKEGALVANWIRSGQSGRTFKEIGTHSGKPAIFRFQSGQRCFQEHRTRPGRMVVQRSGRVLRQHVSLADLAEDYSEHMGLVSAQIQRG